MPSNRSALPFFEGDISKLLADTPDRFDLAQLIKDQVQGDYIYMYPPRQAYRAMDPADLAGPVQASLSRMPGQPLNLYLHFPFCRQICGFCNLYSVATSLGARLLRLRRPARAGDGAMGAAHRGPESTRSTWAAALPQYCQFSS